MWYLIRIAHSIVLATIVVIALLLMTGSSAPISAAPRIQPTATSALSDYSLIAFLSGNNRDYDVYVMNADGSDLRNLTGDDVDDSQGTRDYQSVYEYDLVWSPDGRQMAFVMRRRWHRGIYMVNADGSELHRLTNPGDGWEDLSPAWSSDGRQIAFVSQRNASYEIYVINADGSNERRLTANNDMESMLAWSPDGRQILFCMSNDIYALQVNGARIFRLTRSNAEERDPVWSPDGRQIAFASNIDGDWDIYVMDADGGNTQPLTHNDIDDGRPIWSPDGTQIVYSVDRGDRYVNVHVMDADGSNARNLTKQTAHSNYGSEGNPTWSPDGRQIAFSSYRTGNSEIYVMDADGGNLRRLTFNSAENGFPVWQSCTLSPCRW